MLKASFVLPLLAVSLLAACGDKDFCPDPLVERGERCSCPAELMESSDGLGCELPDGGRVMFPDVDAATNGDAGRPDAARNGGPGDAAPQDAAVWDAGAPRGARADAGATADAESDTGSGTDAPDLAVSCGLPPVIEGVTDEVRVGVRVANLGGTVAELLDVVVEGRDPRTETFSRLASEPLFVRLGPGEERTVEVAFLAPEYVVPSAAALPPRVLGEGTLLRCALDIPEGEREENDWDTTFLRADGLPDMRIAGPLTAGPVRDGESMSFFTLENAGQTMHAVGWEIAYRVMGDARTFVIADTTAPSRMTLVAPGERVNVVEAPGVPRGGVGGLRVRLRTFTEDADRSNEVASRVDVVFEE